jgi:hypothetical protein
LKYFGASIDLIKHSRNKPTSKSEIHSSGIILHRFYGITTEGDKFCVQIKEDKKRKKKFFMSCFLFKNK